VVLDVPTKLENTVCGTVLVRAMLHIKYHWDFPWLGWLAGGLARLELEPQEINVLSYMMLVCDGLLCGSYLDIHLEIVPLRRTRSCAILP